MSRFDGVLCLWCISVLLWLGSTGESAVLHSAACFATTAAAATTFHGNDAPKPPWPLCLVLCLVHCLTDCLLGCLAPWRAGTLAWSVSPMCMARKALRMMWLSCRWAMQQPCAACWMGVYHFKLHWIEAKSTSGRWPCVFYLLLLSMMGWMALDMPGSCKISCTTCLERSVSVPVVSANCISDCTSLQASQHADPACYDITSSS